MIAKAIVNESLAKKYELSYRINPFYLRGDFNGGGKIDVATLVKQRSTGQIGIVIINGANDEVTILGAGIAIGNGGRASREQERSSQRADLLEWEALHLASAR